MKKFLSLALALIMTMSLVTVGAGATFTDDDTIEYIEAVDVIAALGIVGGYADGSFAPDATLTRGAAAKIICNMILGPTTAGALSADTAPFPDVAASHVFAGYIAYCAQQGILSGYADGTFKPEGEVTGYQFMKMLLGALGYNSTTEGFTGDNWSVNVAKLALSLGLEDGNDDFVGTVAMTREEACLYAFNTLQTTMVEYSNNTSFTVGDISFSTSSKATEMTTSKYDYNGDGEGTLEFCEKYFSDLETYSGSDAFGRPSATWEYDGDEIGEYIEVDELEASFVGSTSRDDLFEAIGDDAFDDLEDGESKLTIWTDGVKNTISKASNVTNYIKENSSTSVTGRGSYTDVFVDDDNNVTVVIINTYLVIADDDYDDDDEELDIDTLDEIDYPTGFSQSSIDNDDVDVTDFEEDDYILVTIADGEIQSAVLAEVISETVSTYSTETSVTMGGTKYYYSSKLSDDMKDDGFTIGDEATVVLDDQGNVLYVDDANVSTGKYVFIDQVEASSNLFSSDSYYAAAYFSDGTYAEIELDEIFGDDADDYTTSELENKWYTYKANSDGSYDLKVVEDDYLDSDENADMLIANFNSNYAGNVISSGSVTFTSGTNGVSIKGNSSTVFVLVDDDDDVYTWTGISNVADVTVSSGSTAKVYALMDGSYAAYVFVDASAAKVDGSSSSASDYLFALYHDKTTVDADDNEIYEFYALVDGEIEYVAVNADEFDMEAGVLYYDVTVDGDDYIDDADEVSSKDTEDDQLYFTLTESVVERSSDVIEFSEDDVDYDLIVGDDAVLYLIVAEGVSNLLKDDGADYEVYEYSTAKSLVNAVEDYAITATVSVVLDDDDSQTISALYLYVTKAPVATVEE